MNFEQLNKKQAEFKEALHLIDADFKIWFPFTHNGKEYKSIEECLTIKNTLDNNPMLTYYNGVGVTLPGDLRIALEDAFCKVFPDGLFNGHSCD
jgi:hypothetical protein